MNINGVAKPNAFETSGLPNASRQHRNDKNKKTMGVFENRDSAQNAEFVRKTGVSKALGFAVHSALRAQIMFKAAG